jgi:hypothetical protein
MALVVAFAGVSAPAYAAVNVFKNPGGDQADAAKVVNNDGNKTFQQTMTQVISTLLVVLGMIAVIVIIIGGIRYTTSNGDQSAIKSAKNTILYAVVGLVVAILAFAIVNFTIAAFK